MGAINPQRAAAKIAEKVSKGEKVVLGKILKEVGYSDNVSRSPTRVTNTIAFKKAFALEQMAIADGIKSEINRIKVAMSRKNLDNEEYRVLAGSLDILVKNIQLLSGGATERNVLVLPSEVIERNKIATKEQTPLLENGSTEPQNNTQ